MSSAAHICRLDRYLDNRWLPGGLDGDCRRPATRHVLTLRHPHPRRRRSGRADPTESDAEPRGWRRPEGVVVVVVGGGLSADPLTELDATQAELGNYRWLGGKEHL